MFQSGDAQAASWMLKWQAEKEVVLRGRGKHTTQQAWDSRYNGAEGHTHWYEDAWCTTQERPINNLKYTAVETL